MPDLAGETLGAKPLPTKRSCLQRLHQAGLLIDTVVDVGVLTGTEELIEAFPNARHLLFEPLASMNEVITAAYSRVAHELHNIACFSEDGQSFLVATSIDGSGHASHSRIAAVPATPGVDGVVSCEPIRRVRLDSMELVLGEHVLLKVDVDGVDLEVLKGATELLARVDVVIVEAPLPQLLERSNFLVSSGFRLYDVVDLCYYHSVLSQVDVVFVKDELFAQHAELEPWSTKTFAWSAYQQLSEQLDEPQRRDLASVSRHQPEVFP
jgi:FkbM family methyltransferase